MAGATNYTEQNFLDFYYRRQSVFTISALYTRLFTAISDTDVPTATELSNADYTQYGKACAAGVTNWVQAASQGNGYRVLNRNTTAFSWGPATVNWASVVGAGIYDGNAGGSNPLWLSLFGTARQPNTGDTFRLHNGTTGLMNFDLDTTTAAGITNTAKQAFLNHIFYANTDQVPATAYIRLYTSATALNLFTGASGTEVSGGGYSPLAVTSASAWHAAASVGTGYHIHNSSPFNGWSAASAAWGAIRYAALVDSGGTTFYAIDQLATDVQIDNGDTFSIATDGWLISLDESN